MSEICTGMQPLPAMEEIRICRWTAHYELEKQVMEATEKKYTLVLPHHAVLLRPITPKDLPEGCQMLIMGTLQPEFPYEGGIMREIHRSNSHGSCWWCPHMGAWLGLTSTARTMAHGAMAKEWTAQFHHSLGSLSCVDSRCVLFQDLSLAHPLVEGLSAALPPLMPHPLSIFIYVPAHSAPQYACRAACQYHSLGYRDITICHQSKAFPAKDVPWARACPIHAVDAALLHMVTAAQPALLFHYDTIVPSAATLKGLYAHWERAPHCLHSLLGTLWKDNQCSVVDTARDTTPCTIIEPHCFILTRTLLTRYFALIADLPAYHAMTRGQFFEVGLSWAVAPPHQAHPLLRNTLEYDGIAQGGGGGDLSLGRTGRHCVRYMDAGLRPPPPGTGGRGGGGGGGAAAAYMTHAGRRGSSRWWTWCHRLHVTYTATRTSMV